MTEKKVKKPVHLTATLKGGLKIMVICKDIPDLEDQTTATIEKVTCLNCLKVYDQYLDLDRHHKFKKISDTKH